MERILLLIVLFLLLTSHNGYSQSRSIKFEDGDWETILAKAKKENKLIFLDAYTVWCGPCKWMAANVFTNDTVADFYNEHFINAKIDMEKGEGIELAKKYAISAYPSLLYVHPDGEIAHRSCGSSSASTFILTGKAALDPEKQFSTFKKSYDLGNREVEFMKKYLKMLSAACLKTDQEINSYFETQNEKTLTSRQNWEMMYSYSSKIGSREIKYLEQNSKEFESLYTKDSVESKLLKVYYSAINTAIKQKDADTYKILKERLEASTLSGKEKILLSTSMGFYYKNGDWINYGNAAIAYLEKYAAENANTINSICWNFYEKVEDKDLLSKAEEWAKKAVGLEGSYAIADTYAAVLYKLGKKDLALAAAEMAISKAKSEGIEDYEETAKLIVKIKAL